MHQVDDLSRSSIGGDGFVIDVVSAMAIMAEPRRGGMTLRPIRLVRLISGQNFLMANLIPIHKFEPDLGLFNTTQSIILFLLLPLSDC